MGTFGDRIRTLRIKKGLNQKELAERIDMQESTISRYENDRRSYQWDGLVKLADALDTSVDYLLGRTNISTPIGRLVSDGKSSDGAPPFLEAYSDLPSDDQSLVMERIWTLYDLRKKEKAKTARALRTLKRRKDDL
ncbi:MAG: helix-turn-helix transcriptional regulator [Clostridiales Family XIII bacterium]|nr:helix-turn-helix transcriptional regulator [Clostridiales Family XIII bacterium]